MLYPGFLDRSGRMAGEIGGGVSGEESHAKAPRREGKKRVDVPGVLPCFGVEGIEFTAELAEGDFFGEGGLSAGGSPGEVTAFFLTG
jgi:hypothetical protein